MNEKFILSWNKDGFRDYLEEKNDIDPSQIASEASLGRLLDTETTQTSAKKGPNVVINIEDSDELGDVRFKPAAMRRLLQAKPELALLLYNCVREEGIASYVEE